MPIAAGFDDLGCIAAAQGRGERAARLFGAAKAVWDSLAASLLPWFVADYERGLAAARLQLGEAAFAAAWAEGRAMSLPLAITYALERTGNAPRLPGGAAGRDPDRPAARTLTRRERDVLVWIGRGYTNRQIAEELVVSERTVEWHVSKLLSRLGLRSRGQLAFWAFDQGVLPTE